MITDIADIVEKINRAYKLVKSEQDWKNSFIENGHFLKEFEKGTDLELDSMLEVIFSKDEMLKLAKQSKTESGYELNQLVTESIKNACIEIGMNEAESINYSDIFWNIMLRKIKEIDIDIYNQVIIGKAIRQTDEYNKENKKKLDLIYNKVSCEQQARKKYRTIKEVDERLKQITNPSLGLDFFDYEDSDFTDKLLNSLDKECIYVEGKSREEVFYCILEQLNKNEKSYEKDILIIDSIMDWEEMRDNVKNTILIPSFFNGTILPINNNINIFSFGENEHCTKRDKIVMRKRLRNNLQTKLQNMGLSYQEAYKTIEMTHGLFVTIKRRFFQGRGESYPYWYLYKESVLIDALLLGSWCDSDAKAIEELMEINYQDFIIKLNKFISGEDPYIVISDIYGEKQYQLANPEEAWEFIDEEISDRKWMLFCEKVVSVISTIDNVYHEPYEKRIVASFRIKERYSNAIKQGILRSLVLRRNINENKLQYQIDDVITKILNEINTIDAWCYLCNYIEILCEASPKAVLNRLEKELINNTGMLEVMGWKTDNSIFSIHYYTHIIWAMEYLLQMPNFVVRAVRWFLAVNDLCIEYSISNSPKETLKKVFCSWHHESALNEQGIIEMATIAVEQYKEGWQIISNELPTTRGDTICGSLSKPRYYNIIEEEHTVTMQEMNNINIAYLKLCLDNANCDATRWKRILEGGSFRYYGFENYAISKLENSISVMGDKEKRIIKDTIREEIYKNRHFANSEWALSEDFLTNLENLYNRITFVNPIWDFTYLFENEKYGFPLLHPKVYKSGDYSFDEEQKMTEQFITSQMKEFKDKEYSLINLIDNVKETYNGSLGKYIAEIYCENQFNNNITYELLKRAETSNAFLGYAQDLYKINGSKELRKIVDMAIEMKKSNDIITKLCSIQIYDVLKEETIIDNLDENIQSEYWKSYNLLFADNYETCKCVIQNALMYSNADAFFQFLENADKYLSGKDYLFYLKEFMNKEDMQIKASISDYYLEKIFAKVYQEYSGKFEMYPDISKVELYFRHVLPWNKLKCFLYLLKSEPDYYAQMIDIVYLHEEEEKGNISEKKQSIVSNLYRFYYEIKFCPCVIDNGDIELSSLEIWVDRFKKLLERQKQSNLFTSELGKLFANSPNGTDGYKPHESVRKIIEELNDEELSRAYRIAIFNSRGVYSPDAGVTETKMAEDFKNNANAIRIKYPFTADIYDRLSEEYLSDAVRERKAAEDGRY